MTEAAAMTKESRPRFLLARGVVVVAVAMAMIGSSAPSPIYGLYQAHLHLDHVWLTAIYGAYSVGTVFALFVLGRVSDGIGDRRLLLLAALVATIAGAVIMALAHGLAMLLIGRVFAGMGTGCIMGPATAALVELDPLRDRVRAAIVATVAVTAGITSGVIISAAALEMDFAPTVSPFVVLAVSAAVTLVALRLVPWAPRDVAPAMLHPAGASPETTPGGAALLREAGLPFVVSCAGMATAWMAGGSFLALGAIFARRLAGIHDPAVAALTVAVFQIVAGCAQLGGRNLEPRRVLVAGAAFMALGLMLATAAAALGSAALFCLGALLTGAGYGCGFSGAAAIGSRSAPARGRATIVSFTYVAGYLGNLLPVLTLGLIADRFGLFAAIATLACAAVVCGGVLAVAVRVVRA
ncbi:MFS transporter [Acidisoma sp.]|uniref:MFS transporter n=1 Tax=Acidisoma sp. TaxID=1872115 RepID=UPI003B00E08E